jgi:transcriptional regulator with XRE-family HTH domain
MSFVIFDMRRSLCDAAWLCNAPSHYALLHSRHMKPHELVARLVREAGGSTAVAKAMGKPNFQGTLHKFCSGNVPEPTHSTAKRIADFFGIPEWAIFDPRQAAAVYEERFGPGATTNADDEEQTHLIGQASIQPAEAEEIGADPLTVLRLGDQEDREEVYETFRRIARRAKRRNTISDEDYRKVIRTIDQWEGLP